MRPFLYVPLLLAGALTAGCGSADAKNGITEPAIRAFFDAQIAATRRYDADAICNAMAADYRMIDRTEFAGEAPVVESYDKARSCASARKSNAIYKQAEARGGRLAFDQSIAHISIAPNALTARVRYRSSATLNGRSLLQSVSTETLAWRDGKIVTLGGGSESRADLAVMQELAR